MAEVTLLEEQEEMPPFWDKAKGFMTSPLALIIILLLFVVLNVSLWLRKKRRIEKPIKPLKKFPKLIYKKEEKDNK